MGYDLLCDLPGVSGLLATVGARNRFAQLDPSVEGTGPRSFVVRVDSDRLAAFASTAPRLTYRDDWPNVPLHEAGYTLYNSSSVFRQLISVKAQPNERKRLTPMEKFDSNAIEDRFVGNRISLLKASAYSERHGIKNQIRELLIST
jgi:hypothetical protein